MTNVPSSVDFRVRSKICTTPLYRKEAFLRRKYLEERLSARKIAVLTKCSHEAVNRALKKFGLVRDPSRRGRPGFEVALSKRGRIYEGRRKRTVHRMLKLRSKGMTYREIAAWLEEKKVLAPSGRAKWYAGTVRAVLNRAKCIP